MAHICWQRRTSPWCEVNQTLHLLWRGWHRGVSIGRCLTMCARKFVWPRLLLLTTPTNLRCALLRTKLTWLQDTRWVAIDELSSDYLAWHSVFVSGIVTKAVDIKLGYLSSYLLHFSGCSRPLNLDTPLLAPRLCTHCTTFAINSALVHTTEPVPVLGHTDYYSDYRLTSWSMHSWNSTCILI